MLASRNRRARALAVVVLTLARPAAQLPSAQQPDGNRVADLLLLLDAKPGSVIADVGAGDGLFTVPIARAVGPNGRAVAVDISEAALTRLRERVTRENAPNVDVILGAPDDPHLPVGRFDAAFIHNAYHEMTEHDAMLRHIYAALKPGGRLLIVEPMHGSSKGLPREQQVANHDIAIDIVDREVRAVGFDINEREEEFITFQGVSGGFWLMLARRR